MNRLILLTIALISVPLWADDDFKEKEDKMDKEQIEMIEERMEEEPTSTSLGGSRGGDLDIEKNRDEKEQHDFEKQRQLYEYDDQYRRGL